MSLKSLCKLFTSLSSQSHYTDLKTTATEKLPQEVSLLFEKKTANDINNGSMVVMSQVVLVYLEDKESNSGGGGT